MFFGWLESRGHLNLHELWTGFFIGFNGRNNAPNRIQTSTMPAMINIAPRHPKLLIRMSVSGEKMNVPRPEPHTAIPVMQHQHMIHLNCCTWRVKMASLTCCQRPIFFKVRSNTDNGRQIDEAQTEAGANANGEYQRADILGVATCEKAHSGQNWADYCHWTTTVFVNEWWWYRTCQTNH